MEQRECRQSDGRASSNGGDNAHQKREGKRKGKERRKHKHKRRAGADTVAGNQQPKREEVHKIIGDWNW